MTSLRRHDGKYWEPVVELTDKTFETAVCGHEVYRTILKIVLFVEVEHSIMEEFLPLFYLVAIKYTNSYALHPEYRFLFGIYDLSKNEGYPESLPDSFNKTDSIKVIFLKNINSTIIQYGGGFDRFGMSNNFRLFIYECCKYIGANSMMRNPLPQMRYRHFSSGEICYYLDDVPSNKRYDIKLSQSSLRLSTDEPSMNKATKKNKLQHGVGTKVNGRSSSSANYQKVSMNAATEKLNLKQNKLEKVDFFNDDDFS